MAKGLNIRRFTDREDRGMPAFAIGNAGGWPEIGAAASEPSADQCGRFRRREGDAETAETAES